MIGRMGGLSTEPIDVSGRTADFETQVSLSVPSDVTVDGETTVMVHVAIDQSQASRTLEVALALTGDDAQNHYAVDQPSVRVTVSGPATVVDGLAPTDVSAVLDVGTCLRAGTTCPSVRPTRGRRDRGHDRSGDGARRHRAAAHTDAIARHRLHRRAPTPVADTTTESIPDTRPNADSDRRSQRLRHRRPLQLLPAPTLEPSSSGAPAVAVPPSPSIAPSPSLAPSPSIAPSPSVAPSPSRRRRRVPAPAASASTTALSRDSSAPTASAASPTRTSARRWPSTSAAPRPHCCSRTARR